MAAIGQGSTTLLSHKNISANVGSAVEDRSGGPSSSVVMALCLSGSGLIPKLNFGLFRQNMKLYSYEASEFFFVIMWSQNGVITLFLIFPVCLSIIS